MSEDITKKVLENHLKGHLRIYEFIEKENPIDDYWKEELENEIEMLNPIKIIEEKPKSKSCEGCTHNEEFTGICRNKEGICVDYNKYKPIVEKMGKKIEVFYDVDNNILTTKTTGLGLSKIQLKLVKNLFKREIDYYIEEIERDKKTDLALNYCANCGSKIK